jgi:hypothetical protein
MAKLDLLPQSRPRSHNLKTSGIEFGCEIKEHFESLRVLRMRKAGFVF